MTFSKFAIARKALKEWNLIFDVRADGTVCKFLLFESLVRVMAKLLKIALVATNIAQTSICRDSLF